MTSIDKSTIRKISEDLFRAEVERIQIENPSKSYPSVTVRDAYDIQDSMVKLYAENGFTVGGYKVGCTLCAKWKELGVTEPFYGRMFKERIFEGRKELNYSDFLEPRLEPEIVFVLKKDINGSDCDAQKVADAIDYSVAAIEIVDSRTVPSGKTMNDIIADEGSFGACLPNTARKSLQSIDLNAESVDIFVNGSFRETGKFLEVMNGPINSVVWLAERLAERGHSLKAGDIILSGSCIAPLALNKADSVELRYSSLGNVTLKVL
jgi:2-keto-4-pentenoate hydratase